MITCACSMRLRRRVGSMGRCVGSMGGCVGSMGLGRRVGSMGLGRRVDSMGLGRRVGSRGRWDDSVVAHQICIPVRIQRLHSMQSVSSWLRYGNYISGMTYRR